MKYFETAHKILENLKNHLENPVIRDKDGLPLGIEINDFSNMEEFSPLKVPVLYIGELAFSNPVFETDQLNLKIPNFLQVEMLLIHFFQDETYLKELILDLGDKILQRIEDFSDDRILDKEINFEVKYSRIKEGAFGSILMVLRFQLNLNFIFE